MFIWPSKDAFAFQKVRVTAQDPFHPISKEQRFFSLLWGREGLDCLSSVYNGENILFSVSCLWIKPDTFMGCLWVQVWGSKLQWCSSCCLVVSIKNSFSWPRCLIFLQYSCIHTCCVCICIQAYLILPLFTLLHFTDAVFTNSRQEPPTGKKIATHFTAEPNPLYHQSMPVYQLHNCTRRLTSQTLNSSWQNNREQQT